MAFHPKHKFAFITKTRMVSKHFIGLAYIINICANYSVSQWVKNIYFLALISSNKYEEAYKPIICITYRTCECIITNRYYTWIKVNLTNSIWTMRLIQLCQTIYLTRQNVTHMLTKLFYLWFWEIFDELYMSERAHVRICCTENGKSSSHTTKTFIFRALMHLIFVDNTDFIHNSNQFAIFTIILAAFARPR